MWKSSNWIVPSLPHLSELFFSSQASLQRLREPKLTCFSCQTRNAAASIQARTYADAKASPTEVSSILEQRIRGVQEESNLAETGRVLSIGYVKHMKSCEQVVDET